MELQELDKDEKLFLADLSRYMYGEGDGGIDPERVITAMYLTFRKALAKASVGVK